VVSRHRDVALGGGEHMLIQVPGHTEHRIRWIVSVGRDAEEELRDLGADEVSLPGEGAAAGRTVAMIDRALGVLRTWGRTCDQYRLGYTASTRGGWGRLWPSALCTLGPTRRSVLRVNRRAWMSVALALALVLGFAAGAAYVDTGGQPTEAGATVETCAPLDAEGLSLLETALRAQSDLSFRSGHAMGRFEVLSTA
jgi:hypothetical protein